MDVEERDLLGQFSAYVKTAITRTRSPKTWIMRCWKFSF